MQEGGGRKSGDLGSLGGHYYHNQKKKKMLKPSSISTILGFMSVAPGPMKHPTSLSL